MCPCGKNIKPRDSSQVSTNEGKHPAVSKHLSVLENAGLVWREKRGQNVHYGLKEDALAATLVHFLGEVCPRSRPLRKESAAAARKKATEPGRS